MRKPYDVMLYVQVSVCVRLEADNERQAEMLADVTFDALNGELLWKKVSEIRVQDVTLVAEASHETSP